jgi:hypothetical protein
MALSQLNSTNESKRKELYSKLFVACRNYFAEVLKDGADAKKLITAYVDARHIRGIHETVTALGFIDLTPEETKACREAALQDVLLEMKVKEIVVANITQYDNYAKSLFARLEAKATIIEAEVVAKVEEVVSEIK